MSLNRISMIALAIVATVLLDSGSVLALSALEEWNTEARDALPIYIKVWLGLMMLNNLATLFFVKNHVAARWVFAGFFVSHAVVMVMWSRDIPVLAGQVSLFHIVCWTPGFFWLIRKRDEIKFPSAYAVWATLACLFYIGSMIFDIRDATTYLRHVF